MKHPRRRPLRLHPDTYAAPGAIASINTSTLNRAPHFSDTRIAAAAVAIIHERAAHHQVPIYAYCVMPDHVHLVLGPSPGCDIVKYVAEFKGLSARASWQFGVRGSPWQRSFFDHMLRAGESLAAHVRYVLENPVRAGLVARWNEYPHSGCLALHADEVMGQSP